MRAKRAIAAKMLHDATIHLMRSRKYGTCDRALAILSEAERRVKNGFGPFNYDYFNFDAMLWDGKEPLYNADSIDAE